MPEAGERRYRFEDKSSEVSRVIQLPVEGRFGALLKSALRAFLLYLGVLARHLTQTDPPP